MKPITTTIPVLTLFFSLFMITTLLTTAIILDSNSRMPDKIIVVEKEKVVIVEKAAPKNNTGLMNQLNDIYLVKQLLSRESGGAGGIEYMKFEAKRWDKISTISDSQDALYAFNHISLAIEYMDSGNQGKALTEWLEFLKYSNNFKTDYNELIDKVLLEAALALKG